MSVVKDYLIYILKAIDRVFEEVDVADRAKIYTVYVFVQIAYLGLGKKENGYRTSNIV